MHPIELDATLKLAKTKLRSGQVAEAEAMYRQVLKEQPESADDSASVRPGNPLNFTMGVGHSSWSNSVGVGFIFADADGDNPTYAVNWGDGSTSTGTQSGFSHTYAYSSGGKTYSITGSGTTDDGTFEANSGTASIVSIDPTTLSLSGGGVAYEKSQTPAYLYVSRTGDTSQPLSAALNFGGTEESSEYQLIDPDTGQNIGASVTIPAHQSSAEIEVIPLDDSTPEWTETIDATIAASGNYDVDPDHDSATISVADNDLGVTLGSGSDNIVMQGSSDGTHNLIPLVLNIPSNLAAGDEITLTVSQPGEVDVWTTATPGEEDAPVLGTTDSQTISSVTYTSHDSIPETLWVGGISGSAAAGDIKFTISDSDLKASPPGFTTNSAVSNAATCVMLHINLQEDPNNSGFLYKDVANQTLYWLPGQVVDLKATL